MRRIKNFFVSLLVIMVFVVATGQAGAADYLIDSKNAHAFIQFKISHMGFSYVLGRFNNFEGTFTYDEAEPSASKVKVVVDVASVDSNHAERDKHLRGKKFFEVKKYPKATFVSSSFTSTGKGTANMKGEFTLHGVTRPIVIKVRELGFGKDPWGGYRRGFEGSVRLALKDYNINTNLGPMAREVELFLSVEGIRQK